MITRRLVTQACCLGPEPLRTSAGDVALLSRCHPERGPNQDGVLVLDAGEAGVVLAVADGMGGHADGELAARLALESVADEVEQAVSSGDALLPAVRAGFERAGQAIAELGTGAGTTLVATLVRGARARSVHTGDSLGLVCDAEGILQHRTRDHSPSGYALAAGLISEEDALLRTDRNVVLSALGYPEPRIEEGPVLALGPGASVLLASDGLTDNLLTGEILDLLEEPGSSADAVAALDERARDAMDSELGKRDDLTLLLLRRGA